ncbi:MAG TPA: SPOR domain-containing protein [Holophagaceae bacterium]|nr:SPOR domain-containing protein [Holophagaceae bacterium]
MSRSFQTVITSQRHILWAAGAGVALLTLAYLLGVQVGKQGVALRKPLPAANSGEDLKSLPEPLTDQLRDFESEASAAPKLVPVQPAPEAPKAAEPDKADKKGDADKKPEARPAPKAEAEKPAAGPWTLQLVTTKDPEEARRVAKKAEAAGFKTVQVKEKGLIKVRLAAHTDRPAADTAAEKLKKAGLKPFAMKAD